ncbi:MAG: hypothetical protein PHS44_03480 [Candidatus Dojkabacteria bacterium]|jgi:uncharacterized damage-inducible protein DinB|nr:hypothetical protein [Candidatus Dojkabacteria bacterium]
MDTSKVKNPEALRFLQNFFIHRYVNRGFYQRVQEKDFDFRMVDNSCIGSDSIRESLAHQISVQRNYLVAVRKGELVYGAYRNKALINMSKEDLLKELEKSDKELVKTLSSLEIENLKIKVRWSTDPIPVVRMFWAMYEHEIFHTGWNVAVMDHLGMKRFPALKKVWG